MEDDQLGGRSTRKRSRASDASDESIDIVVPKKSSRSASHESISTAAAADESEISVPTTEKTAIKGIISALMKNSQAKFFLYPVDAESFPEYYEMIKKPMDLTNCRDKLNAGEYTTSDQALADLRLIWENCRLFNAEGSDIYETADALDAETQRLVGEKLGPQWVKKYKSKGGKKSDGGVAKTIANSGSKGSSSSSSSSKGTKKGGAPAVALPKKVIQKIIKEMKASEHATPFLHPVDLSEAPGYMDVVEEPMDLSNIDKLFKSGQYEGVEGTALFSAHMHLISANCNAYNDPNSSIAQWSNALVAEFDELFKQACSDEVEAQGQPMAVSSEEGAGGVPAKPKHPNQYTKVREAAAAGGGAAASSAAAPKKEEGDKVLSKMKRVWREISKDPRAGPFSAPIDMDEAPGYEDMIVRPMDLATVKVALDAGSHTPDSFRDDMRLIFDNCMKYNLEESELYVWAKDLQKHFEEQYNLHVQTEIVLEAKRQSKAAAYLAAEESKRLKAEEKERLLQEQATSGGGGVVVPQPAVATAAAATAPTAGTVIPLKSMPAKAVARGPDEARALLSLLDTPEGYSHMAVREKAVKKIRDRVGTVEVPCWSSAGNYEVHSFGEIVKDARFCTDPRYFFAQNFATTRTVKLCLLPATTATTSGSSMSVDGSSGAGDESNGHDDSAGFFHMSPTQAPFVNVDFTNTILLETAASSSSSSSSSSSVPRPLFRVTIEGGTVVADSHEGPRAVWELVLSRTPQVLRCLGSKLRRCRAVFNRLCISPMVIDFLEPHPLNVAGAADYYRTIAAPMWMKEIHSRLKYGSYDNEFDFAWDMRLVFTNAKKYNLPGSELYEAAQKLAEDFEHLLCNWVYNVQDVSVFEVAKGPWDDWGYLKYFDSEDPKEDFCRETGTRTHESALHGCHSCEDQYLRTLTEPAPRGRYETEGDEETWICTRCEAAKQLPVVLGPSGYSKELVNPSFNKDNFPGGKMFLPAFDFGPPGWCQARKTKGQGQRNVYFSPLGYELLSKEEATAHKEFEKTVNDQLLASRAAEFKEWREQMKGSGGKGQQQRQSAGGNRHKKERGGTSPERRTSGRNTSNAGAADQGGKKPGEKAGSGSSPPLTGAGGGLHKEGDEIEANYRRRGKYFPGRIVKDHGDGTYDIDYNDGDKESHVESKHIRSLVPVVDPADEEGLLPIGKLCDFTVPTGCRIGWYSVLSPGERHQLPSDKLKAAEVPTTAKVVVEDAGVGSNRASPAVTWSQMPIKISGGKGCVEIASITAATAATAPGSTNSANSTAIEAVEADTEGDHQQWPLLPPCGFFGLEELDVRQCLECLEGSETYCHPLYRFSLAQDVLNALIVECKADLYRLSEGKDVEAKFNQNVAHEKWFWYLMKRDMVAQMRDPKGARDARTAASTARRLLLDEPQLSSLSSSSSLDPHLQHKKDFATLFPASYSTKDGEMALVLWDFLDSASPVLGDLSFTLNEIIKCLARPPENTPTLGQTVFDEIGTLFAGALLREMELDYAPVVRDLIWQEMLMAKPLNVITWPFIARCLLLVMRQYFQHTEALFVFHSPATEEDAMMQDEIFCLTFAHPLITDFLFEAGVATDDGSTPIAANVFTPPRKTVAELKLNFPTDLNILRVSPNGRSLFSIRYKCLCEVIRSPNADETSYEDMSDFMDDFMGVFLDVLDAEPRALQKPQETEPRPLYDVLRAKRAAYEILHWLVNLCERWKVQYNLPAAAEALAEFDRVYGTLTAKTGSGSSQADAASGGASTMVPPPVSSPSDICWDEIYLDPFSFSDRYGDLTPPPIVYKGSSDAKMKTEDSDDEDKEDVDADDSMKDDSSSAATATASSPVDDDRDSWIGTPSRRRKYRRDLAALAALERTLQLLRSSDPETWATHDRVAVMSSLMDKVADSERLKRAHVRDYVAKRAKLDFSFIGDVPQEPTPGNLVFEPVKLSAKTNVPCHFTGADSKFVDSAARWVAVPEVLLSDPVFSPLGPFSEASIAAEGSSTEMVVADTSNAAAASSSSTTIKTEPGEGDDHDRRSSRASRHATAAHQPSASTSMRHYVAGSQQQPIALEIATKKVAAAREYAYVMKLKQEERTQQIVAQFSNLAYFRTKTYPPTADGYDQMEPPDLFRGNPLGRDRYGNEYWLLFAQRRMPLVAQYIVQSQLDGPEAPTTVNPMVLMREPGGWWGFHSGRNMPEFISTFSTNLVCESVLRENIVEALHYTKKLLLSKHLVFLAMHNEWVERHAKAEKHLERYQLPAVGEDGLTVEEFMKRSETLWARCIEVRVFMHNGLIYKNEHDTLSNPIVTTANTSQGRSERDAVHRRHKKMREQYLDDAVEHHPIKGWFRYDHQGHMRELWAASLADRLHADSLATQMLLAPYRRSRFLHALIPSQEDLEADRLGGLGLDPDDEGEIPAGSEPAAASTATVTTITATAATAATTTTTTITSSVNAADVGQAMEAEDGGDDEDDGEDKDGDNDNDAMQQDTAVAVAASSTEKLVTASTAGSLEMQVLPPEVTIATETAVAAAAEPMTTAISTTTSSSSSAAVTASSSSGHAGAAMEVEGAPVEDIEVPRMDDAPSAPIGGLPLVEAQAPSSSSSSSNTITLAQALAMNAAARERANKPSKCHNIKIIEQLHITTGEPLRIYPTGKDAALFLNVSQSGISLCCSGTKPDAYGFKWRFYEGPMFDWDFIEPYQTPLETLQEMQIMRGKRGPYDKSSSGGGGGSATKAIPDEQREREREQHIAAAYAQQQLLQQQQLQQMRPPVAPSSSSSSILASTAGQRGFAAVGAGQAAFQSAAAVVAPPRPPVVAPSSSSSAIALQPPGTSAIASSYQAYHSGTIGTPQMVASTVLVSGRLARLKAEMVNVLYLLPEKPMRWMESPTAASDEAAADEAARLAMAAEDEEYATRSAEDRAALAARRERDLKVDRKLKRRQKRKAHYDRVLSSIQGATCPQELLFVLIEVERAIPRALKFTLSDDSLPSTADTCAALATRIYALDRKIRYDEIKDVEKQGTEGRTYRPRTQFAPRCILSSSCSKFCFHPAKCLHDNLLSHNASGSRVPEIMDVQHGSVYASAYASSSSSQGAYGQRAGGGYAGTIGTYGQTGAPAKKKESGWSTWKAKRREEQMAEDDMDTPEKRRLQLQRQRLAAADIDIENILPYIPHAMELNACRTEWV